MHSIPVKFFRKSLLIIAGALSLTACGGIKPYKAPVTQGIVITDDMLADLQPGLTQNQVRYLLGPNYGTNPFQPHHWEYIFQSTDEQLHLNSIKHLIVKFDADGYLLEWQKIK